ncbi:MAG: 2-C-methyl-D-erythritol 2,4-cyclodiphosphate synthase, partial [Chloroflexota bacterium]|nr:2-C-methyl-D-erythritol 2,4-cyclodiphosphate synthase [Chloroflexota bacterium]
ADSLVLLATAAGLVRAAGWTIGNIDATVIAEAPKVNPHVPAMRAAIGQAVRLDGDAIGIKATTNEGMGFVGRGEGIAALAVATVYRDVPPSIQNPGVPAARPTGGSPCAS